MALIMSPEDSSLISYLLLGPRVESRLKSEGVHNNTGEGTFAA